MSHQDLDLNSWSEKEKSRLLIESSRVGLLFLVLLFSVAYYVFQSPFINWSYLSFFYVALIGLMLFHLAYLLNLDFVYKKPWVLLGTFMLDLTVVSFLVFQSGLNQTFFLFVYMILIALGGFVFRSQGALVLALVASIGFSFSSLWIPEVKIVQHILLLAINNIAFFIIAGLSGYLSEQLFQTDKQLQKAGLSLKVFQKLNELLIQNIPSGLLTVDPSGNILQSNPSAHKVLPDVQFEKIKFQDLFKNLDPRQNQLEVVYEEANQEKRILSLKKNDFFHSELGQNLSVVMIDDLTQVRELEGKVRQSEKLATIGQLAASIAHEIRNPLTGISGSIELLSQTSAQEDDKKLMKIILREIDRLNNLITEFLDYSKPESAPTDPVNLKNLLQEILDSLKLSKYYRPEVEVRTEFQSAPEILGKSEKLKQVFLNMIINSYQAMAETANPVLFVQIQHEKIKNQIFVRIKDNGQGMSEATQKRLFEPFHTTKPKGTGLGLAVTYKILESHKAEIQVKSSLGQGAEFILVFPCASSSSLSK